MRSVKGLLSGYEGEVYRDVSGQWRWRVTARNNRVVAEGGESYHNKADAKKTMESVCRVGVVRVSYAKD